MVDNRTMAQMLQAPIEGYEYAIVVPQINANNFELKQTLINLVQSNQFTGGNFLDKIPRECLSIIESKSKVRYSRSQITDLRANTNAPLSSSLPSNSFDLHQIAASLEDKLDIRMNRFEKSLNDMKNSFVTPTAPIKAVEDKPNETFNEAWEHFKDLLRQCPHHGFSELHQLDTLYNALNSNDQDAFDFAAGGNFLDKIPRECLSIIESKSKVRYSRSRITDSRANTNARLSSSLPSNSFDLQQIAASLEDKLDIHMNRFEKSLNDMKNSFVTPTAPIKAVEEVCVTCGANHSYNQCPLTRGNDFPVFQDMFNNSKQQPL
nr:hypothetical protein [Tanacetum cinerariifolium]